MHSAYHVLGTILNASNVKSLNNHRILQMNHAPVLSLTGYRCVHSGMDNIRNESKLSWLFNGRAKFQTYESYLQIPYSSLWCLLLFSWKSSQQSIVNENNGQKYALLASLQRAKVKKKKKAICQRSHLEERKLDSNQC